MRISTVSYWRSVGAFIWLHAMQCRNIHIGFPGWGFPASRLVAGAVYRIYESYDRIIFPHRTMGCPRPSTYWDNLLQIISFVRQWLMAPTPMRPPDCRFQGTADSSPTVWASHEVPLRAAPIFDSLNDMHHRNRPSLLHTSMRQRDFLSF